MAIATSIYQAGNSTQSAVRTYLGGDDKLNSEPIHDELRDFDAGDFNRIVAALSEIQQRTRKGCPSRYEYSISNAVTGHNQLKMFRSNSDTSITQNVMPWGGSLVGISVMVENALTAGTLTINWLIADVAQTLAVQLTSTDQSGYAVQLPGVETFDAGDLVTAAITTDGSFAAGATPSVFVDLLIAFDETQEV